MPKRYMAWSGALTVMAITAVLVVLDISDASVHRYWSRHSFTSSVLAGLLVLLLTVLIVDRVTRSRQLSNQSRAIAAQAALIVAQAKRAAEAVTRSSSTEDARGGLRRVAHIHSDAAHQRACPDRRGGSEDIPGNSPASRRAAIPGLPRCRRRASRTDEDWTRRRRRTVARSCGPSSGGPQSRAAHGRQL